jgi:predicted amidohydrolase YtcJ
MVVLDRDILTIPPDELKEMKVDMTIVGGEVIYQRK